MPILKSAKHEAFAQEIAKGRPASQAYAEIYKTKGGARSGTARVEGSKLLAKPNVAARVLELKEMGAKRTAVTIESITNNLMRIGGKAEKLAKGGALGLSVARASQMDVAKLNGLVVDKSEHTIKPDLSGVPDEQLGALAAILRSIFGGNVGAGGQADAAGRGSRDPAEGR